MGEGSQRAVVAAMLANLGLAVAKFVAFLATGASSMLARVIDEAEDGVRERVPIAVRIYLEPDLQREAGAATSA